MYLKGKLLILLSGTLSFIGANSHLLDNGDSTVRKASESRFVLLIDNSDSMSSHDRMNHVHNNAIRWILQLKPATMVTIIKFGSSWSLVHDWVDPSIYQRELVQAINSIQPNGGGCNMASGLEIAQQKLLELEHGDEEGGVVMAFTAGEINEGADVGNEGIWGILLYYSIKVTSILMGARINAGIETLSRETQGKVFSVNYDGSNIDGSVWASQTWMSTYVVDNYEWMISHQAIPGVHQVACDSTSHRCIYAQLDLDDQIINDITITIRLMAHNGDPNIDDYIELVHVEDPDSGDVIGGWKYSVDSFTNQVTLENSHPDAGQYRIVISLKKRVNVQFVLQVKVTGHRRSPSTEPYVVTCQYPQDLNNGHTSLVLITGQVKQGNTVVKAATVTARVSKSMDEDPTGTERSCYFNLRDDGLEQYSGDLRAFDGVHSYIMDPRGDCWGEVDLNSVEKMQVMCTMVPSPDETVDENNFFS